jgi:hypothetical protein
LAVIGRGPLRAAVVVLGAVCVSLLLVSCGGSYPVDSSSAAEPVSGRVFPPSAHVVLVELSDSGKHIQTATATDATGTFVFPRPLTGERVEALAQTTDLRLPALRSGRLLDARAVIEVTPLTTLYDHAVQAGGAPAVAAEAVARLVGSACGSDAAAAAAKGLSADSPLRNGTRDWLLPALAAYLDAFHGVGLSPQTPGLNWLAKLQDRSELLAQLCATSRQLFSDAWLASAQQTLAAASNPATAEDNGLLLVVRPHVAAEVLKLIATRIVVLEYPEFRPSVYATRMQWQGTELVLAAQLAAAEVLARTRMQSSSAALASPGETHFSLDRSGAIVQAWSQRMRVVDGRAPRLRLENHGGDDLKLRMAINGWELSALDGLLDQVLALPALSPDEPLWRRAWRLVVLRTRWAEPFTGGLFWQQPDLFLRSIGQGQCDVLASVLHRIWQAMGFDARVFMLSGHLVPEIRIAGAWQMYDPTYGIYYFNRNGAVASVDDLAGDPQVITMPVSPTRPSDYVAYSQFIADWYSSREDNWVEPWYSQQNPQPLQDRFLIPRGGYLELIGEASYRLPARQEGVVVDVAPMRIWFPPGYSGPVDLPLILLDIAGVGRVSWADMTFDVTPVGMAPELLAYYNDGGGPATGLSRVHLESVGPQGLVITMAANPLLYRADEMFVAMTAADLTGLTAAAVLRDSP